MMRKFVSTATICLIFLFGISAWASLPDPVLILASAGAGASYNAAVQIQTDLSHGDIDTSGVLPANLTGVTTIYDVRFDTATPSAGEQTQLLAFLNAAASNTVFLMGDVAANTARNQPICTFIAAAGGGTIAAPVSNDSALENLNFPFTTTPNTLTDTTFVSAGLVDFPGTGAFIGATASGAFGSGLYFPKGRLANATPGCLAVVFNSDFAAAPGGGAKETLFRQNLESVLSNGGTLAAPAHSILIVAGTDSSGYGSTSANKLKLDLQATNAVTIALSGVPANLNAFQQIYDLRVTNQPVFTPTEQAQYVTWMNSSPGKMLFLMGENAGFAGPRNLTLSAFIALAGGGTIAAPVSTSSSPETVIQPFNSTPNALTTVKFAAVGLVTSAGTGSFGAMEANGLSGGLIYFSKGKLANALTGCLVVTYDINFIYDAPAYGVNEIAFRQNLEAVAAAGGDLAGPAASTVTLASSANPSAAGGPSTLTAVVAGGSGTPTGSVSFLDGSTVLGSAALSAGSATYTFTSATPGNHTLTAQYSGDVNYLGSTSSALTQVVSKLASSVVVTSSANPAIPGATITFTANVTCASATPSGTVDFYDGGTVLANVALAALVSAPPSGGQQAPPPVTAASATFSTSTLPVGSHAITARFNGTAAIAASTSAALDQMVGRLTPAITLVVSSPNVSTGWVTFRAQVTGAGINPTGSVLFYDGTTLLGPATLAAGNASLPSIILAAGSHAFTAVFPGDALYEPITSAIVTQTISKRSSSIVLVGPATAHLGETVTFTATVVCSAGGPSGSVTFADGGAVLATVPLTQGSASYQTSGFAAGSHALTVSYAGDATTSAAADAALTHVVSSPAVVLDPVAPLSVQAGSSVSTPLNLSGLGSVTGSITFTVSGLPHGATCEFSSDSVDSKTLPATITATIRTNGSLIVAKIKDVNPFAGLGAGALFAGCLFASAKGRKRVGGFLAFLILVLFGGLTACSSSSKGTASAPAGTPAGAYVVTITATAPNASQATTTIALNVTR